MSEPVFHRYDSREALAEALASGVAAARESTRDFSIQARTTDAATRASSEGGVAASVCAACD